MINIREMTVLITDDMENMAKSIHNMLKVIGYGRQFLFATEGEQALSILRSEPVDLVLLDYNMPGLTGGEVLSQIRDDRDLRDLPVVMVTAEAYSDFVAEVGESEIDAYILKPVTVQLLEEKVTFVVNKVNNPPPMVYHLKRARGFEEAGDLDSAISEAKLAMETNPKVTRPIRELGYFYYKKNELKKAEKFLLKAAEQNYLDVFAFHYLGEIYLKFKEIEKAAHYFQKAMEISPRHLNRGINFGKTLVQMNMTKKATQIFDKTLEYGGGALDLKEEIATFCIEADVDAYAVKLLESVVREQPNRADVLYKLATALEKTNELKKAVNYLSRAQDIDDENDDIKIHLAQDYLALKKPMMAEGPLKKLLKINPNNELARELLKQCA